MDEEKMPLSFEALKSAVEGILFAMGDPVSPEAIGEAVGADKGEVVRAAESLKEDYLAHDRGVRLVRVNGAYQLSSAKSLFPYLVRLKRQPKNYALSDVILETLAIIAYKQPVTRAEIEKIRGVSSDHAVSKLVEYGLVQELGRMDAPGRPMLFGTTDDFLRAFGLESVKDLPEINPVQAEVFKLEAEEEADESSFDKDPE